MGEIRIDATAGYKRKPGASMKDHGRAAEAVLALLKKKFPCNTFQVAPDKTGGWNIKVLENGTFAPIKAGASIDEYLESQGFARR